MVLVNVLPPPPFFFMCVCVFAKEFAMLFGDVLERKQVFLGCVLLI